MLLCGDPSVAAAAPGFAQSWRHPSRIERKRLGRHGDAGEDLVTLKWSVGRVQVAHGAGERRRVTQVPQLPALQPKSIATECSSASSSSGDSQRLHRADTPDRANVTSMPQSG